MLFLILEKSFFKHTRIINKIMLSNEAIKNKEFSNPTKLNSKAPIRKPKPLTAFFDPVIKETHLNNFPFLSGANNLTELLELIFVRSLAIPDKP